MGLPAPPSGYRLRHRPLSKQCHASSIAAVPVLPQVRGGPWAPVRRSTDIPLRILCSYYHLFNCTHRNGLARSIPCRYFVQPLNLETPRGWVRVTVHLLNRQDECLVTAVTLNDITNTIPSHQSPQSIVQWVNFFNYNLAQCICSSYSKDHTHNRKEDDIINHSYNFHLLIACELRPSMIEGCLRQCA